MAVRDCDVAIIGAGLSGLVCARAVKDAGLDVAVLEARSRVGGRLMNASISDVEVVEMGGQFVGPVHERVRWLLGELGLETFRTYDAGKHLAEFSGRVVSYRWVPTKNPLWLLDAGLALWRTDRAARHVCLDDPWGSPRAVEWDSQTADTWIRRTARTRFGRSSMTLFVRGLYSCEPSNLSALHLLTSIRAAGGLRGLVTTDGGAQQDRIVGGSQLLCLRLAEKLTDCIHLESPLRRLEWSSEGVVASCDDRTVSARRAVLALPAALAACVEYRPVLPFDRCQLMQRMPHGNVIKCMAVFDEPWWRATGLSGQASSENGVVSATFDSSPPGGSPGVLVAFVEGRRAQQLSRLGPTDRRAAVLDALSVLFGPRVHDLAGWLEHDWSTDEWSRGCYGAHLPPGVWTQYGRALRDPVGPLHWAGSETAKKWPGYMDGAIESGLRAAGEVVAALS